MNKILIISFLIGFGGCSLKRSFDTDPAVITSHAIELLLDSAWVTDYSLLAQTSVREIYKSRNYRPLWIEGDCIKPAADSLVNLIQGSAYYGLNPTDYHLELISDILKKDYNAFSASTIDVLLTDVFFALYSHLDKGRLYKESSTRITHLQLDTSAFALFSNAIQYNSVKATLEEQEPLHGDYQLLKQALASRLDRFNKLSKAGTFVQMQRKSIQEEIKKIAVNLERWRWEASTLPERYLIVNIPEFKLHVFDFDTMVLESKVVVGTSETPSPVLESVIECFTIYPYWHVPRKIAIREMLPIIQGDTAYLRKHNFDILDKKGHIINPEKILWQNLSENNFPYVLRQREGEENSLGIIKFRFDNPYAVYLHDTNTKKLFNLNERALSHGCVRVQKAIALAHYLVSEDSIYCSNDDLDVYFSLRKRKEIELVNPIPVYIRYFTYAKNNGEIVLLEDIYGKDKDMINELYGATGEDCGFEYRELLSALSGKKAGGS